MLSWRLWQSMAADINDPIFRRVSQIHMPDQAPKPRFRLPRLVALLGALAMIAAVIHLPALLILVFVIPMLMIATIVAAPLLVPIATLLAGMHLTAEVISGIYREKRQYTYDLICALTQGRLSVSWSFATGITHRDGWFPALHWGTLTAMRIGLGVLAGLSILALSMTISGGGALGFEQARLLVLIVLLLALYYSNMVQTLVTSLIIGLLSSSFEWSKPDATVFGVFVYVVVSAIPWLAAGLILFAFGRLVVEPAPLMRIAVESTALLVIIALRELVILLLWRALKWRLNSSQVEAGQVMAAQDAALGVA